MPRGLPAPVKAALNQTSFQLPVYCLKVTRTNFIPGGTTTTEIFKWAEVVVPDVSGPSYEARLIGISNLEFSPDQAGTIDLYLSNVDGVITTEDRRQTFIGAQVDILAYLADLNTFYPVWSGWSDDLSELTPQQATLRAYPIWATPNLQAPKRILGLPCTHTFGNTTNWVSYVDFDGSECPYQRTSSIGFSATLPFGIFDLTDPQTFSIHWTSAIVAAGGRVNRSDVIRIDQELFLITSVGGAPDAGGNQSITCQRGYKLSTKATHAAGATVFFANCFYSTFDCRRRGMFGNNPADNTGGGFGRNYYGGFPFLTGFQYGTYRSKAGERTQPLRLVFSGNDSAYGRVLSIPYGRCRIADPILLMAKPEGDFLTTLWAVAEGILGSTPDNEDQSVESNAYTKTIDPNGNAVENIYVNGVSRHDRRDGYGIEAKNGEQDQDAPSVAFFPSDPSEFRQDHFGFWGTARVTMRINTKDHPSVDVTGQSISGAFEVQYGRIHRVYTSASTFVRRATDDGVTTGANPIWVLLDLMSSKRAGGGIAYSRFNLQSFVDAAAYCSTSITNTFDGSSVKRWTFNGIIDQRKSLEEWTHLLCLSMYALKPQMDATGKYKIRMLKSETLTGVPIFSSKIASTTGRNIIWNGSTSSLVKSRRSTSEIPNEIRINFVDKSYNPNFAATLNNTLSAGGTLVSFNVHWGAAAIAAGVKFIKNDKIIIQSEKFWITNDVAPPDGSGNQHLEAQRAYSGTTDASHSAGQIVQFTGQSYTRVSIVVSDREAQDKFGQTAADQSRRTLLKSYDLPGVTTVDEAARLGTLLLRAGEFGEGGLANNNTVTFNVFYRDAEDLEIGDIIEVEDDQLDPALNERYYRVVHMQATPVTMAQGGFVFSREIRAVLHDNNIYDDQVFTYSDFTRVDAASPSDMQPPPVTAFFVVEDGIVDENGTLSTNIAITYEEPSPRGNFRSVVIYRSSDDGAGNPVGDWRFIGEVFTSGQELQDEVLGRYVHYAALSRALSGHVGDIDAQGPGDVFIYPRIRILLDGMADTSLPAPTGLDAFGRENTIYLKWDAYTGIYAQLFKRFNVYRSTTNNTATAVKIAESDTNWFKDEDSVVTGAPTTTFYYWVRGVSRVENVIINGVTLDGLSPFSAEAHDNAGDDVGLPNAPQIEVLQDVSSTEGNFVFVMGIAEPVMPINWDTVDSSQWQISRVSDFSTLVWDFTYAFRKPPFVEFYHVPNFAAGVYYFRARVFNIFGASPWSDTFTRSTDYNAGTTDTDIMGEVENLTATVTATGSPLQGDEVVLEFDLPLLNSESYWGFRYLLHTSSTLPTPDVDFTNSSYSFGGTAGTGNVTVGSNVLTDNSKSFPTTGGGLIGRQIGIFSIKRVTDGTATHADEALVYFGKITGNTATTITFEGPIRLSGANIQYYVMTAGGLSLYDKVSYWNQVGEYIPVQRRIDRHKVVRTSSKIHDFYAFILPQNLWGSGKDPGVIAVHVEGLSASTTVSGITGDGLTPTAPSGLSAAAAFRSIILTWTNSANTDLHWTEVWRSTSNSLASATLLVRVPYPQQVYGDDNLASGTTFFYWVRHVDWDGLNSAYNPVGPTGVSATTLTLTITETEITNNSISTPKLQANAVTAVNIAASTITADKLNVSQLSAISANLGTITAGTVTGATLQTASSGVRVVTDTANGIRGFSSSGLAFQFPVDGTANLYVVTLRPAAASLVGVQIHSTNNNNFIQVDDDAVYIYVNNIQILTMSTAGVHVGSAVSGGPKNILLENGQGIQNTSGNAAIGLSSNDIVFYAGTGAVTQAHIDNSSSSTQTPLTLRWNGADHRVAVETADLGTGTKNYLHLL